MNASNLAIHTETFDEQPSELLLKMFHHPCAPLWNHRANDSLQFKDLQRLHRLQERLEKIRPVTNLPKPSKAILAWLQTRKLNSLFLFKRLLNLNLTLETWSKIPTMSRQDIVLHLTEIIPNDAPLKQLRSYRTAGTTGHPVIVPHCAYSVATYQVFLQHALKICGVNLEFSPDRVACFLIGAQARTVTYATTLNFWNNAGFAKINLDPGQWRRDFDCALYLSDFNPQLLTGDPISFAKLLEVDADIQPKALITTAVAMSDGIRTALKERFKCPVIDWYSLTETGPIGFQAPGDATYRIIAPDIFVECLDEYGEPVPDGAIGEITVTGGRNPFLPLVRYRTGDFGMLNQSSSGEIIIEGLEGRKPVIFYSENKAKVNSVDIAGCLRPFPIIQYEVFQKKNLQCEVRIRTTSNPDVWIPTLQDKLAKLFGHKKLISIIIDQSIGQRSLGGKVVPYRSEFLLEE